uniref:Serpin domain-containing protein n=1 Tax=Leersia perrieri TaxID=77586 RepID=A0A0D9W7J4_9ORYZ
MDRCLQVAWIAGDKAITEQSNFMFSPLCVRAGLALLATGTDGETLRQLLSFLAPNTSTSSMRRAPSSSPRCGRGRSFPSHRPSSLLRLGPDFQYTAAADHRAFVRPVDFQTQAEAATVQVNRFFAQATKGRLTNVIPSGTFKSTTKCVLANAMHFKATWARKFDPSDTVRRMFHRADGTSVRVPFLSDPGIHYATSFDRLGFKVLQLFYKMVGHDNKFHFNAPCFCMLVFLPTRRDGLRDLLRMAVTEPDFVMRCVPRTEQQVAPCMVPKFKFSAELDAAGALRQLGLAAPFDPVAADLSKMAVNPPPEGLYKCAVEVDEEGTTAVAATYEASSPTYSPGDVPTLPMSFVAD